MGFGEVEEIEEIEVFSGKAHGTKHKLLRRNEIGYFLRRGERDDKMDEILCVTWNEKGKEFRWATSVVKGVGIAAEMA